MLRATKSGPAGVPYDLTPEFLNELFTKHRIDYVIHGDDPCLLPDGTDAYEHAKKMGRFRMVGCSKPSQALGSSQKSPLRALTWGIRMLCCIFEVHSVVGKWHGLVCHAFWAASLHRALLRGEAQPGRPAVVTCSSQR